MGKSLLIGGARVLSAIKMRAAHREINLSMIQAITSSHKLILRERG